MTASVITGIIAAAAVALSGVLAYRAQNRGVTVNHEGVVLESYDELVAHLRAEVASSRVEMEAMRAQLADAMGREARCEARIKGLSEEVAALTEMVRSFTDPGSPD